MGDHKRQVFKALQLAGLLMANLQTHRVVALFQLQRILWADERKSWNRDRPNAREKTSAQLGSPGEGRRRLSPLVSCSDQRASRADCRIQTRRAAHRAWGSWGWPPHSLAEDKIDYKTLQDRYTEKDLAMRGALPDESCTWGHFRTVVGYLAEHLLIPELWFLNLRA